MQRLEVSGAVQLIYVSLGVKRLKTAFFYLLLFQVLSMPCHLQFSHLKHKVKCDGLVTQKLSCINNLISAKQKCMNKFCKCSCIIKY